MKTSVQDVREFVAAVRRRKNRHGLWAALFSATAVGAAALTAVGASYVWRGYAVPGSWIAAFCGGTVILAFVVWIVGRMNADRAARYVDEHFALHDATTSCLHFAAQERCDGYYALQAQQTAAQIAELDVRSLRYHPSRRLLCAAFAFLATAIGVSLCPPSAAVLAQQNQEQRTAAETATSKEELVAEAEKLIAETHDPDEEKLLEPNKLRRWIEELKATPNRTEALRQYARLERKLNELRQSIQRKQDEQLLDRAAEELAKQENTKALANNLAQKDYDKAGERLVQHKPDKAKSDEQRRNDIARLKAIAQRMTMAAKASSRGDKSPSNSAAEGRRSAAAGAQAASGQCAGKTGDCDSPPSDELTDKIEALNKALADLEKAKSNPKECRKCQCACCQCVDDLANHLKKLAMCRRTDARLCRLCRCCGQCQSNMACSSPNPGGKKAGWGTNTARREQRDELADNGQTTQLTGQKWAGPSVTSVEAADSGSGVSQRRSAARERAFKHQFEAFVQREDVPESVRDGVKQYFEIIHEADGEAAMRKDATP